MFCVESSEAKRIQFVSVDEISAKIAADERLQNFTEQTAYQPLPGSFLVVWGADLLIEEVYAVYPKDLAAYPKAYLDIGGKLATTLRREAFFVEGIDGQDFYNFAIGWGLAQYRFDTFLSKKTEAFVAELVVGDHYEELLTLVEASYLVRDLVNTPANHMTPEDLQAQLQQMQKELDCDLQVISGKDLLSANFPAIYAVGKASAVAPRLLELRWGDDKHPLICLVGKGVCFDSGGYDMKPSSAMRLMKKDMGGAATAIGLAQAIIRAQLPVRLQLLVPAVENLISGDALKPGDIMQTRKGLKIEIENTDAEGRLVLCDALSYACEGRPQLLIDFATLTGAARVALGQDLPALFSNRSDLAQEIQSRSFVCADPVWHLPLYQPYQSMLASSVGDLQNSSSGGFAGAISAALYLDRFVDSDIDWLHFDLYAWAKENRPSGPSGGEAYALRLLFSYLQERFTSNA